MSVANVHVALRVISVITNSMIRPAQPPEKRASKIVAVRLTPPMYDALLKLVDIENQTLAARGMAPLVTTSSYVLSTFLRAAESAGIPLLGAPQGKLNAEPLKVLPARIRSKGSSKRPKEVDSRYTRILRDDIIPRKKS